MLRYADHRRLPVHVGQSRVLEEAQCELQPQDAPHRGVDIGLVKAALRDGVEGTLPEARRRHDQVVTGLHRDSRRLGDVGAHPLLPHHPTDVVPVRDERPAVAPLAAQHLCQQPGVGGDGHAVHRLIAEHEARRTRPRHSLERRQEPRSQLATREVGFAGIAPTLGLRVARKVLGAGQNGGGIRQAVALVAAHHGHPELTDQHRILAERLVDPAPAQIAGDAQHRGERPMNPGRRHLHGGDPGRPLDQIGIPRARHRQLGREDRGPRPEGISVDAVVPDQQGYAEAGGGGIRHRARDVRRGGMQDRADHLLGHQRLDLAAVARIQLQHLADLLRQRHSGEQLLDPLLDRT